MVCKLLDVCLHYGCLPLFGSDWVFIFLFTTLDNDEEEVAVAGFIGEGLDYFSIA